MNPDEIEGRLAALDERLARIEARFAPTPPASPARISTPKREVRVITEAVERPSLVTSILGWGGALALVLAAAYLIRLAIDSGWLTPMRQVALAVVGGLALILAGFALKAVNRIYAGLLPAGGIAILFLATYGAHHYYGFIDATVAAAAIVAICLASLWLCRAFESDLYALFAVAGSYSAPLLLSSLRGSITDLVIYFSAWSAVFSAFAVWHGRRLIYLLAMYLALITFDVVWRRAPAPDWLAALAFQAAQFAIFAVATALYSMRRAEPLGTGGALAHLPPLLLFYFLQYTLLDAHLPGAAPWIGIATAAALALAYGIARATLKRPLPGGELLLWAYVALVLFHAGYLESVPRHAAPWVAFLLAAIAAVAVARWPGAAALWPVWLVIVLIFLVNYLRAVLDSDVQGVPGRRALALAYAGELYVAYWLARGKEEFARILALYAAHIAAMAAALHIFETRIVESTAWAILALACLGLAWLRRDRLLGQSSLLLFGAAAGKVMLYDLSGAPPVTRIVSLVVLGVVFYAGGLLYQRIDRGAA